MEAEMKEIPGIKWKEITKKTEGAEGNSLEYRIMSPELDIAGSTGRRLQRYYDRTAQVWAERWKRLACRPDGPRRCSLSGRTALSGSRYLSIRMEAVEEDGNGRENLVCWGDVWDLELGRPVPRRKLLPGGKRRTGEELLKQGRERKTAGLWFPDRGWEEKALGYYHKTSAYLTEAGTVLIYPQGLLAPPAEGTPEFLISFGSIRGNIPWACSAPEPEKEPEDPKARQEA